MPAWIEQDLTTLAFCWRLARRDGVTIGLTSHDRDLMIDGLLFRATPGMLPSAIERTSGLSADSVELSGAITADALSADDLAAGRWDGARLHLFAIDWTQPDAEQVPLMTGALGAVDVRGEGFQAELRGAASLLDQPVIETTSPDCRATLGDGRCRVDMAGRVRIATVAQAQEEMITLSAAIPNAVLSSGQLRWIDGPNAGLSTHLIAHDNAVLTLADPPHFAVDPGTRVELTEGCDRRFSTCASRFANAANFRGEPHLPGNDLLTRYAS
jgi:uncharacterized phage protein (TIGR02218 family)